MPQKYRFILDSTELTRNPENWKDIEVTLERQKDIDGLLLIFTSELIFVGDGYDLLKTEFDNNYNNRITANIDRLNSSETYDRLFTGAILLSDIQFNLNKKTATVKIEDISFFGAINGNKNIKNVVDASFTKNGIKITAITKFNMDFFVTTGANPGSYLALDGALIDRDVFRVVDVLDFLVRFMTDDEVKGITSTYLANTTNFNGGLLYMTTGELIRLDSGEPPVISFKQLFTFLRKTHNISFVIETDSNGDPVMRIEDKEFFFETTTSFTRNDINDLELSVDKQKLFSHLQIGNTESQTGSFPTNVRFFVFQEEDYVILGKGNIDKSLDLRTNYVTDSNTIEDIVLNDNDDFDNDIFIIEGNSAGTQAIQTLVGADYHYNDDLTNDKIVNRYLNSIPNSVAAYLTADSTRANIGLNSNFLITSGSQDLRSNTYERLPFIIESGDFYDSGNNFQDTYDGNGRRSYYNVPFTDDFSFGYTLPLVIDFPTTLDQTAYVQILVFMIRLDSTFNLSNVLDQTNLIKNFYINTQQGFFESFDFSTGNFVNQITAPIVLQDDATYSCSLGDVIFVGLTISIQYQSAPFDLDISLNQSGSLFRCEGSQDDGGVFKVFKPEDYRALIYKFKKNTNFTDFNTLTTQSLRRIRFNEGSNPALDKLAWIDKINHKVETSETDYQLIT
ncbi:MAG: hypothetical protein ACUZ8H_15710 [Candidatus Anammoxibacter sp.]